MRAFGESCRARKSAKSLASSRIRSCTKPDVELALQDAELKTSSGRYSGQDNRWFGLYITPVTDRLWDELKTHPNIRYKPFGAGSFLTIPEEYR